MGWGVDGRGVSHTPSERPDRGERSSDSRVQAGAYARAPLQGGDARRGLRHYSQSIGGANFVPITINKKGVES